MKTYGKLLHHREDRRVTFGVAAQPHVMIKVKRHFPQAEGSTRGQLLIRATPAVARDLEWVLDRYPLDMDDATAKALRNLSQRHRETEEAITSILNGATPGLHLQREPARPGRAYQVQAAEMLLATGRLLLADDVGLGKTTSAILAFCDPLTLPAVFVTLTHLPLQMQREIKVVAPWLKTHVVTGTRPYATDADVLILSYSKLDGWGTHLAASSPRMVVFDEIQELRRGHGSKKFDAAVTVAAACRYRIGLSATPVYNYGDETHNVFQVLAPDELGARDEFLREWGGRSHNGGTEIRDPRALGAYLRDTGLMLRRTRADVGRELPDIIRVTQTVDADPGALSDVEVEVEHLARILLDGPPEDRFRAAGAIDWKLRQATGEAKAPHVAAFVRMLLDSEEKVVLYGWHRNVYDRWLKSLADFAPRLYTGTESPKQKDAAREAFMTGDSRLLIISLRAGAGLDGLQKVARVCVFGELDWSPGVHHQAEGRLHRDGQPDPVVAYYLTSEVGSDPVLQEVLGIKRGQSEPLLDPTAEVTATRDHSVDRMKALAAAFLNRQHSR